MLSFMIATDFYLCISIIGTTMMLNWLGYYKGKELGADTKRLPALMLLLLISNRWNRYFGRTPPGFGYSSRAFPIPRCFFLDFENWDSICSPFHRLLGYTL